MKLQDYNSLYKRSFEQLTFEYVFGWFDRIWLGDHVFVSVLFEFPIKPEHFKMEKKNE